MKSAANGRKGRGEKKLPKMHLIPLFMACQNNINCITYLEKYIFKQITRINILQLWQP